MSHGNEALHEHPSVGMRPMYWVWFWLLAMTGIEVFLAYLQMSLGLMLIALIGLSVVKAALIIGYFMHLKFERMNLVLTIIPALVACILLMNIFFPDAKRLTTHGVNRHMNAVPPAGGAAHP